MYNEWTHSHASWRTADECAHEYNVTQESHKLLWTDFILTQIVGKVITVLLQDRKYFLKNQKEMSGK